MTKSKTTKRALIMSMISLLVCVSMLIGTTYAWFTDSVTSGGNIIKSGTLSIDLAIKAKGDQDYVTVPKTGNTTKKAFDYLLWEPGYTEVAYAKVTNTGSLALKYTMSLNLPEGQSLTDLANVIDVYYAASEVELADRAVALGTDSGLRKLGTLAQVFAAQGSTLAMNDNLIPEASDYATIVLHMQEEAGNAYQNLPLVTSTGDAFNGFDIQINATQYTYESDSFGTDYDANA